MLTLAKLNLRLGKFDWIPVVPAVALHFLECVPPYDHNGSSFATGEAYDHDAAGNPVYLCFRELSITGIREDPVNEVVCRLRAVPDESKMAFACYMNRTQFRTALQTPISSERAAPETHGS